jgi:hypothetical protein
VLFISHKYWLIDSHGVLHGDVDVLVRKIFRTRPASVSIANWRRLKNR